MGFLRISLLLCCIGSGTLACRNNRACKDFEDAAIEKDKENDPAGYCPLQSKAIACLTAEGCPLADINDMKTKYYNKCSITAEQVTECSGAIKPSCIYQRTSAVALETTDLRNYCNGMGFYQQCLETMIDLTCSTTPRVTVYDVMGEDYGHIEIKCSNVSYITCQEAMTSANCEAHIKSSAQGDLGTYCGELTNFMSCVNTTFSRCDQTLELSYFYKPHDTDFLLYCDERTRDCLVAVQNSCSSPPVDGSQNQEEMCSAMSEYLGCVNTTMITSCDSAVMENVIIGPMRASYVFQCGPEGPDACPAISTCMAPMLTETGQSGPGQAPPPGQQPPSDQSGPAPNILQECSNIGGIMSCFDEEFTKCGRSSPRPYTFSNVAQLYTSSCQDIAASTNLMSESCQAMSLCMANLPLPSDPMEIVSLYYDPEFWCRTLRLTVACGKSVKDSCQVDLMMMDSILANVDNLCYADGSTPGTPVFPTIPGDGEVTDGQTPDSGNTDRPGATRTTTVAASAGHRTHAGLFSCLSLVILLWYRY